MCMYVVVVLFQNLCTAELQLNICQIEALPDAANAVK